MKKYIIGFFATLILSINCLGQIIISGKILDSKSNQPLIGTSIQIENTDIRTISNEEGSFEIKTSSLPAVLVISYVGYKKERKLISKSDFITIPLSQTPIELAEVRVGNPAIAIINAMVKKSLLFESDKKLYRVFYRRISANDGDINRIQEMFANASWNIEGIKEWQPLNIRYAEVNPRPSSNLYFLSFLHSAIVHKNQNSLINTIEVGNNYKFSVREYINVGTDNETAVIVFESVTTKNSGTIYINTKKDQLIKIKEERKVSLQRRFKKRLFFEVNFRENNAGQVICDNIFMTETTGRTLDFRKAEEKIWLYFQNEITGFENQNQIYPLFLKSDQKVLLSVPYNADYWRENIPFPATDNIKKIIEKMERSDKFTSNFN